MTLRFRPEVLEQARREAGLSRDELARRAGVARGTIFSAEKGRVIDPRPAIVKALAEALEVDVADLYASEDVA